MRAPYRIARGTPPALKPVRDGIRLDGDNPTATPAFAEAVTGALPEGPDPAGAALVTTSGTGEAEGVQWGWLALFATPVLGYVGQAGSGSASPTAPTAPACSSGPSPWSSARALITPCRSCSSGSS